MSKTSSDGQIRAKSLLDNCRNIGIAAHVDAGKTTLTERILYLTGLENKIGEVHEGGATMDWMAQEKERGITITAAATRFKWTKFGDKIEYNFNLIDTPGHVDFMIEVERSLRVLDGAVVVFDGVAGVEPQSESVWRQADKYEVPRICFMNKMDRMGADFFYCVETLKDRLGVKPLLLHLPIGNESEFIGVVDILLGKAIVWKNDKDISEYEFKDIPDNMIESYKKYKMDLFDYLSNHNDEIMESLLTDTYNEYPIDKIKAIIRKLTLERVAFPVFCGSAFKNKCVQCILDAIIDYLPSPLNVKPTSGIKIYKDGRQEDILVESNPESEEVSGLAFKIATDPFVGSITFVRLYSGSIKSGDALFNSVRKSNERIGRMFYMHANSRDDIKSVSAGDIFAIAGLKNTNTGDTLCKMPSNSSSSIILERMDFPDPVIEIALEPNSKADQDKMGVAISRLVAEDPSLKYYVDAETGQTVLKGMGELHLEIIVDRMKREFNVVANIGSPRVAYRETITKTGEIDYTHKKQTGGAGQFARVKMIFEPLEPGEGFQFESKIVGGAIPKEYIPSVEDGLCAIKEEGMRAGYPVIDFKVTLVDGAFHDVDSSALAFEVAARYAFREIAKKVAPKVKEPLMSVEVICPEEYMGSVVGDINSRRGRVIDMSMRGNAKLIDAVIPLSTMFGYVKSLRSMTQGRANYSMEFSHYDFIPESLYDTIS